MREMTTRIRTSLTGAFMILALISPVFAFGAQSATGAKNASGLSQGKVFINGRELRADYKILFREGVAFIPISEELGYVLGADIDETTDGGHFSVTFKTYETALVFSEGQSISTSNGIIRNLERPPFVSGGLLYVPLKDFFEQLECDVKRDGDNFQITKSTLFPDVISEAPEGFLASPTAGAAAATGTAPIGTATAPADLLTLQYTYENVFEFENATVSGDATQSNLTPKTDFYHRLNFRAEGNMRNGYDLQGIFKTSSTTERDLNGGKVDTFNLNFYKNKISLNLYDYTPKVSRFVLKSYPLRGVMYDRQNNLFSMTALWGETPKSLRDSYYNRFENAFIIGKAFGKNTSLNAVYSRTKDTGIDQDDDRIDNSVFSIFGSSSRKKYSFNSEFALSRTSLFYGDKFDSKAKWFEAKYKDKRTNVASSYERVGSEFYSETSYFTPGKREFQTLATSKLRKDMTLGTGYKTTKLSSDTSQLIPLQFTLIPLKSRPKMKWKLSKDYERARSDYGSKITDKRKFEYSDRIGKAKADFTIERNRQKDTWGEWQFRTTQRYRFISDLSKKLQMYLQFKKEYKTQTINARKRYYQYKYIYELEEWSELSFSVERYYNGTSSNRDTISAAYKKLDVINDREYSIEYQYLNYRDHNDNSIMASFSFIK